jgi:hypothetical protein
MNYIMFFKRYIRFIQKVYMFSSKGIDDFF